MASNVSEIADVSDSQLKFKLSKQGLVPVNTDNMNRSYEKTNSKDSQMSEDEGICGKCDGEIEDFQPGFGSQKAVMCDICRTYYHQKCGGLSDELLHIVNKYGIHGTKEIPWHCKVCKKYAYQLVCEMVDLRRRQDVIEHEVNLIKSQLEECMGSQPNEKRNKEEVHKTVKEILEQEKRQMNVVIRDLPGIDDNSNQAKILKSVGELFGKKLDVSAKEIETAEKIPTEKGNLVKVQLKSKQARKSVLTNAKRLKDDEVYSEVYLKPDLTFEQRKKDAILRGELKQRRDGGEKNLIIVRGKIVKLKPKLPLTLERT